MENKKLEQLKTDISEVKRQKDRDRLMLNIASAISEIGVYLKKKDLTEIENLLLEIARKDEVKVSNLPDQITALRVTNLDEIKLPKHISILNFDDIKFPQYPTTIKVAKPEWFTTKELEEALKEIKKELSNRDINLDKYTKKSNALAVRLVTRDGIDYYNAGGSSGSGGSRVDTSDLAKEETLQNISYNYIEQETDATYTYYGYASNSGWKIGRKTIATGKFQYSKGTGDYDTAWADKENKAYSNY